MSNLSVITSVYMLYIYATAEKYLQGFVGVFFYCSSCMLVFLLFTEKEDLLAYSGVTFDKENSRNPEVSASGQRSIQ